MFVMLIMGDFTFRYSESQILLPQPSKRAIWKSQKIKDLQGYQAKKKQFLVIWRVCANHLNKEWIGNVC